MRFRSPTAANDTTAVPEFDPSGHGVHSLQVTIKTNCMVTVADEKVSERDKYMSQLRQFNSHVLKVICFFPAAPIIRVVPSITGEFYQQVIFK